VPSATAAKPQSVFRVHIKADIHDVWREITRTDEPILCFFNSRMAIGPGGLVPGSKLAMRTPDNRYTGVVGEITECVPPTRLEHTFKFTRLNDPPCRVRYDLRPAAGGTEFTLTILDAPPGTATEKQMLFGGKLITQTLKRVMETGTPDPRTRAFFLFMKVMTPLLPGKCRSEHWPVN